MASFSGIVSDGVIAYGRTDTWSSTQISHAWMAKIDLDGNLVWKHMLNNGFDDEYIASVLENADGSYAVISRGDLKYFCLSQYTATAQTRARRAPGAEQHETGNRQRAGRKPEAGLQRRSDQPRGRFHRRRHGQEDDRAAGAPDERPEPE